MRYDTKPFPTRPHHTGRSRWLSSTLLVLACCCPLAAHADQYTAESPEGALYNTRTHYYDARQQKVVKRAQYTGLSLEQQRIAYNSLGMALKPQHSDRWQEVQAQRRTEIAERRAKAAQLAKVYEQRRRIRYACNARPRYYYTPYSHATLARMTYFDYWCNVRNYWGYGRHHCHTGHCHHWPYYH